MRTPTRTTREEVGSGAGGCQTKSRHLPNLASTLERRVSDATLAGKACLPATGRVKVDNEAPKSSSRNSRDSAIGMPLLLTGCRLTLLATTVLYILY